MGAGVLCGLLAGAFWGLVFLTPRLLPAFTPWELSIGRYVCYGVIALMFLAPALRRTLARVDRHDLAAMVRQSLAGNIVYYILLAYGVQLAGIAPTSLIIGLLPLLVTLMGRADHGAIPLKSLAWPLATVAAGIACINIDLFTHSASGASGRSLMQNVAGVVCAVLALLSWSWYTLDNTRYLQRNAKFTGGQWSALYGLTSGAIALVMGLVGLLLFAPQITGAAAQATGRDWTLFWLVNAALALGASMIGNQLWNIASRRVPVTLSGQLIIFETLFALLYGFVYGQQWPRPLELAAIVLLVAGVAWAVRKHAEVRPAEPAAKALDGAHG
ncbi:drug/metabolite transporter (DMT)-like permease [Comamonas sp. BIGb0124]|uniref:DMT family transporter n=1 Tax=Comamonas sp. BIGb0124 TaxID=2485130 RepID=UPI000F4AC527|nr:DMT family transporter [Comamonas sp. BIGb0124]ROR17942.1 drug/metabolite transporter (DMT)-like permease [Comamonas sp. BIGb0124]